MSRVTRSDLERACEAITFKSPLYVGIGVQSRPGGYAVVHVSQNAADHGARRDLTRTVPAREALAYLNGVSAALDTIRTGDVR